MSKIAAYSANALLAKARAMYGDILTSEDYAELANCRSTQEFLNYLKNRTAYEMVLKDLPNVQMSRARLEAMLRERVPELGEIQTYYVGPVIGAHCGPGTVAICFFGKERPC